jgi:hypothetical protein
MALIIYIAAGFFIIRVNLVRDFDHLMISEYARYAAGILKTLLGDLRPRAVRSDDGTRGDHMRFG